MLIDTLYEGPPEEILIELQFVPKLNHVNRKANTIFESVKPNK